MKTWKTWAGLVCLATTLWGCPAAPGDTNSADACTTDDRFKLEGQDYCVVRQSIIEMGFECPQDLSNQFPLMGGAACGVARMLPDGLKRDLQDRLDQDIRSTMCQPGDVYPARQVPGQCDSDAECAAGETCQEDAEAGCLSSACSCDGGNWACTADCGIPKVCKAATGPAMCDGQADPSYQECAQDTDCDTGQECLPSDAQVCVASSCSCTGDGWVCTDDCGMPMGCVDKTGPQMCAGQPDPSVQDCTQDSDCSGTDVCVVSDAQVCVPSSCSCDGGGWACTEDCGQKYQCAPAGDGQAVCGGQPDPSFQVCDTDADCPGADNTCIDALNSIDCVPSGCGCEASGGWVCTEDCNTRKVCSDDAVSPNPQMCGGMPDPSIQECDTDASCGEGKRCVEATTTECVSSGCACDEVAGAWTCTPDCAQPKKCIDAPALCGDQPDPSYNRCATDEDCFEGAECVPLAQQVCVASTCSCEEENGGWACTDDCGMAMGCALKN